MKSYGLEMVGQITIQTVKTLPDYFQEYDQGRIIYVSDLDRYYLGGLTDWLGLNVGNQKISSVDIAWGTGQYQVNASQIPILDPNDMFGSENVQTTLVGLATGQELESNCILARHINDRSIEKSHLNLGTTTDTQINASIIPCLNTLYNPSNPPSSNIQLTLDYIANNVSFIVRKTIDKTGWVYQMTSELYSSDILYNPLKGYVNIQLYDENDELITPTLIKLFPSASRARIFVPYRLLVNVIITG